MYDFEESRDYMERRDWELTFLIQSYLSYHTLMLLMLDLQRKVMIIMYWMFFFGGIFMGMSTKEELQSTTITMIGKYGVLFGGSTLVMQWLLYKYKTLYS